MADFKAAIFDLDGTLLESMDVWHQIDVDFLAKRGLDVPSEYVAKITSMSFKQTAEYTIEYFGLNETVEQITREWFEMAIDRYSNQVRLKPNAKQYLKSLKQRGIKLGTATSLPEVLATPALKNNGIYRLFDAFTSTDEVSRGKNYPDIYLMAAQKLNVSPQHCVVFEDILPGVKSALAAGMRVYGVYDRSSKSYQEEIKSLAEVYIRNFAELL